MNVCVELSRRIVAFLDGELPDAEAAAVASHLEACAPCQARRREIQATRVLLAEIPAPAADPRAWRRLRARLPREHAVPWRRIVAGVSAVAAAVVVMVSLPADRTAPESGPRPRDGQRPSAPSSDAGVRREPEALGPFGVASAPDLSPSPIPPTRRPDDFSIPGQTDRAVVEREDETPAVAPSAPEAPAPAGPEGVTVEGGTPAPATPAPAAPAPAVWTTVSLARWSDVKIPNAPAYLTEARAFSPLSGLPFPRGQSNVAVTERENGDLLVDAAGDGRPSELVPDTRDGASLWIRTEYPDGSRSDVLARIWKRDGQWWIRNCVPREGRWNGQPILLLDGDHDGRYDEPGSDALYIDGAVVPLGTTIATPRGALLDVEVDAAGAQLRLRPFDGATATVSLAARYDSEARLTSAVVRSGTRVFELAGRRGPLTVPAGTYALEGGTFVHRELRLRVVPGGYPPVAAAPGTAATVALGGACGLTFGHRLEDNTIAVMCDSVAVRGERGEVYEAVGRGIALARLEVRSRRDGRVLARRQASPVHCPRTGIERFVVQVNRTDLETDGGVRICLSAPAFERAFGSVANAWAEVSHGK